MKKKFKFVNSKSKGNWIDCSKDDWVNIDAGLIRINERIMNIVKKYHLFTKATDDKNNGIFLIRFNFEDVMIEHLILIK